MIRRSPFHGALNSRARLLGLLSAALLALACSGQKAPSTPGACTTTTDCPKGEECVSGKCQLIPCGGKCTADQVCIANTCRSANGVDCSTDASRCPAKYTCTSGKCRQDCTQDSDCPPAAPSCNVDLFVCTGCTFNTDCKNASAPVCDPNSGSCVGCLATSDCQQQGVPNGHYCDTTGQTCKLGCNSIADCPAGTKTCDGASAGMPGKCIQCQADTDCFSSSKAVCDTSTNLCVQCLQDDQCTGVSTRCNPATQTCVACTHDMPDCGYGNICNQSTFTCQPGCSGGAGDAQCPSPTPVCDTSSGAGQHGKCVACLKDSDCARAEVCDLNTQSATHKTCIAGCHTDAQCLPSSPADKNTTCDPNKGTHGTCVQCRTSADCTGGLECDSTMEICRCKGIGEPCTSSSQCGYSPRLTGSPTMGCSDAERAANSAFCVTSITCNELPGPKAVSASVCVMSGAAATGTSQGFPDCNPPETQGCPDGFAVERASDGSIPATAVCVPNSSPYTCPAIQTCGQ